MNRDDIIRMAREAGIPTSELVIKGNGTHLRSVDIERFFHAAYAAGAAAEREACAKVCEEIEDQAYAMWKKGANQLHLGRESGAEMCGRAIKARSEK